MYSFKLSDSHPNPGTRKGLFALMSLAFAGIMAVSTATLAQDNAFSSESEAGVIVNQGNTESQSVTLKSLNKYTLLEHYNLSLRGEYFQTKGEVGGVSELTSENSLVEAKAERLFNEKLGAFAIGSWAKDNFRGFEQRIEGGLGLSYHFIKSDELKFFTEQGYSFRQETAYIAGPASGPVSDISFWRSYFELSHKFTDTLSAKVWLESKMNLEDTEDIEVRIEPSLDVILSGNFSLGLAYRLSFDNVPPDATPARERLDHLYTTTLKVKF